MIDLPHFIVYDRKTKIPLCVGQQVHSDMALYCASILSKNFMKDLIVEEIKFEI